MLFRKPAVNRAHEEGDREEDSDGDDYATERSRDSVSEFTEFFSNQLYCGKPLSFHLASS